MDRITTDDGAEPHWTSGPLVVYLGRDLGRRKVMALHDLCQLGVARLVAPPPRPCRVLDPCAVHRVTSILLVDGDTRKGCHTRTYAHGRARERDDVVFTTSSCIFFTDLRCFIT
jgi:hypothetical protein